MIKARILAAAAVVAAAPVLLPATQAFAATTDACGLCGALTSVAGAAGSTSTTPSVTGGAGAESATGGGADSVNAPGELPLAPFDSTQSLEGEQDIFIKGGQDAGRGAGELVSAAYLGGPQGILDIPAHVLGWPKPLGYVNEG
jgi:hypothetical protein